MGINGHTRLDMYSSCTAGQVTLKIPNSYYSYFPYLKKSQISVNILPRTVQLCRLDQKTPFKMGINGHTRLDLVTVPVRPDRSLYMSKSGMSIDSHLERCLLVTYGRAVQSWAVWLIDNLSFCMGNSYNSYGEFSK